MPDVPFTEQVRELGGQDDRFPLVAGVVVPIIDGLLVEFGEQVPAGRVSLRLGVPVRGRRVAVDRSEVSLAVDERHPHHPVLRHPDEGLVDGAVAVRVVVAHHVPDDLRRLHRLPVEREVRVVVHRVEDAPLDGLESVADVRQGPLDDDRHRVAEEAGPGLTRDGNRLDVRRHATTPLDILTSTSG